MLILLDILKGIGIMLGWVYGMGIWWSRININLIYMRLIVIPGLLLEKWMGFLLLIFKKYKISSESPKTSS